jgi:hypothetical protein
MLLLFLQLPNLVPVHGEAAEAPAAMMSRKSTSDMAVSVATVSVRCEPTPLDRTKVRVTADAPALKVSVSIVWSALSATDRSPAAAIAACVRTLNVFAPEMVVVPVAVLLKVTL